MKYVLVDKAGNINTTVELSSGVGVSGARTYFVGVKRLKGKDFDKLWRVMREPDYNSEKLQSYPGYIKWWEEEKEITDSELKI
mgnify:FL=1|jgi:hypothetical protein|tara:strand:+ start:1089 stop:1337 length:249 start_codon:yes stop_codon:yes gene_type:complete